MLGMGGLGIGSSPLLTGLMGGGLGYMLGSNRGNDQQNPSPAPQQPQPPPPGLAPASAPAVAGPAVPQTSDLEQLKLLGELHASGVLDDDEFAREKQRILDR